MGYKNTPKHSLLVYPAIGKSSKLSDIANRISWGIPFRPDLHIYIPVSSNLINTKIQELTPPSSQADYLKREGHIKLISTEEQKSIQADTILIHQFKLFDLFLIKNLLKIEIIDKNYFSYTESLAWQFLYFDTISTTEKNRVKNLSEKNFLDFKKKQEGKKKSYCFVSGPSFDQYRNFTFEPDSLKVICNSVVKNEAFLNYIGKPDILVFADPVFHFSPCKYSAVFREQMVHVVEKYDCYIATTFESVPLLLRHFPQLENRIIGIKMHKRKPINFPSGENLYVKSVNNILTLLMLPVASALTSEIGVIGADGRKPDEKYFWKHSSSVQMDDLMDTAFETHPSFFRDRDYADYYEEHCEYLEKLINFGEARGRKYYSLTASYIPAFQKRYAKHEA